MRISDWSSDVCSSDLRLMSSACLASGDGEGKPAGGRRLRVLDLFSCIGCHAKGLHDAGPFVTTKFVEFSAWRRDQLARLFPGIPQHDDVRTYRSEEHTSELQSLMRISYAVLCLKKKKKTYN